MNAVISFEFPPKGICKYADFKPIFEMNLADRQVYKILFINGIGYKSFFVILFIFLISRQNLTLLLPEK